MWSLRSLFGRRPPAPSDGLPTGIPGQPEPPSSAGAGGDSAGGAADIAWQRRLAEAQAHVARAEFEAAAAVLRATLEQTEARRDAVAERLRCITFAHLGTCLLEGGAAAEAIGPFERALALAEARGEPLAIEAALTNLTEAHRFVGDAAPAAAALERRAEVLAGRGEHARAAADRRQAAIVRAGEPRCRVIAERNGQRLELDELPPGAKDLQLGFVRNRMELARTTRTVDEGLGLLDAARWTEALERFAAAERLDAFDPRPSYWSGLALLHLGRFAEAAERFARTEALAPGWHHCRARGWLAAQLATGAVDPSLARELLPLVHGGLAPAEALEAARRVLERVDLGLARLAAAEALIRLGRRAEAEAELRAGLARAEEPDVKTRTLVLLGGLVSDAVERRRLLVEARELGGNLVAAAMASLMLGAPQARA